MPLVNLEERRRYRLEKLHVRQFGLGVGPAAVRVENGGDAPLAATVRSGQDVGRPDVPVDQPRAVIVNEQAVESLVDALDAAAQLRGQSRRSGDLIPYRLVQRKIEIGPGAVSFFAVVHPPVLRAGAHVQGQHRFRQLPLKAVELLL